jgi:hypothetical protein
MRNAESRPLNILFDSAVRHEYLRRMKICVDPQYPDVVAEHCPADL